MAQREVTWVSGGFAQWGRQAPLRGSDMKIVGYEADMAVKLTVDGRDSYYFRTLFTGQDEVAPDGSVPRGWGAVSMEDLRRNQRVICGEFFDARAFEDHVFTLPRELLRQFQCLPRPCRRSRRWRRS